MDIGEAYAGGSYWGSSWNATTNSGGYAATFLLIPQLVDPYTGKPLDKAGPVVVTDYEITQNSTGNGIVLVFFDAATVPAAGRALFTNSDAVPQPKFLAPIAPGVRVSLPLAAPWHAYDNGLAVVCSTSYSTLTYATANTFFAVRYAQYKDGGSYLGGQQTA